jgi:pilus assembly protein Flp/PilA
MLIRFIRDETAATAIEYGLIAAIISLAVLVGASTVSEHLRGSYQNAADRIGEATAANE